jgi:hypothetical protein
MAEIRREYNRTLNKIIFDINLQDPVHGRDFLASLDIPRRPKPVAPHLATVPVPPYDFARALGQLRAASFLDSVEVARALTRVRTECNLCRDLPLFRCDLGGKPMEVAEFQKLQLEQMKATAAHLKRAWCDGVRAGVCDPLAGLPDRHELSPATNDRAAYEGGKLRRLLACVNFAMEDALRVLTEESLRRFAKFLSIATAYEVKVRACSPAAPANMAEWPMRGLIGEGDFSGLKRHPSVWEYVKAVIGSISKLSMSLDWARRWPCVHF